MRKVTSKVREDIWRARAAALGVDPEEYIRQQKQIKQVSLQSLKSQAGFAREEGSYSEILQKSFLNISVQALFDALYERYDKLGDTELKQQYAQSYIYLIKNVPGVATMNISKLLRYATEDYLMATDCCGFDDMEQLSKEEAAAKRAIGAAIVKSVLFDVFSPYENQEIKKEDERGMNRWEQ